MDATPTAPDRGPELNSRPRPDWRAALALAWAVGFGLLYARMVAQARFPSLLRFFPW